MPQQPASRSTTVAPGICESSDSTHPAIPWISDGNAVEQHALRPGLQLKTETGGEFFEQHARAATVWALACSAPRSREGTSS